MENGHTDNQRKINNVLLVRIIKSSWSKYKLKIFIHKVDRGLHISCHFAL